MGRFSSLLLTLIPSYDENWDTEPSYADAYQPWCFNVESLLRFPKMVNFFERKKIASLPSGYIAKKIKINTGVWRCRNHDCSRIIVILSEKAQPEDTFIGKQVTRAT